MAPHPSIDEIVLKDTQNSVPMVKFRALERLKAIMNQGKTTFPSKQSQSKAFSTELEDASLEAAETIGIISADDSHCGNPRPNLDSVQEAYRSIASYRKHDQANSITECLGCSASLNLMMIAAKGSLERTLDHGDNKGVSLKDRNVELVWHRAYHAMIAQAGLMHTDPETSKLLAGPDKPFASKVDQTHQNCKNEVKRSGETSCRSCSEKLLWALSEVDRCWSSCLVASEVYQSDPTVEKWHPMKEWARIYTGLTRTLQSMTTAHNGSLGPDKSHD